MKHQLLRHFCSRGSRSVIQTALKVLGLRRPPACLPYTANADPPVLAPAIDLKPLSSPAPGPRSILYLTHRFYPEGVGGTEVFLARLAAAQLALGNQVRIVTLSTGFSWEYPEKIGGLLMRHDTWNGIDVLAIRYQHPPTGLYYKEIDESEPVQQYFAQWCLAQFNPDLVHAVYPQPFAAFLRVCREASVPHVVTATDFCTICPRGTLTEEDDHLCRGSLRGSRCPSGDNVRFEQAERMLCGADFVTVPSAFSAARFAMEIPALQSILIPHGMEPVFNFRHRTAIRHFAFFGALTWSKGVFLLIQAFHKLDGDATLDIYGDGPLRFLLKQYQLLDHRIRIVGHVPRQAIPSCYDRADCVVIPSRTAESYSLVLSEALASGCMVIVSDLGALPQRAQESGGKIFRAGDRDALYRALQNAVDAPTFPAETSASTETECETYAAIYRKVVQN